MKKDVLLFLGSLGRISPFERGTTTYGEPEVFIAVQPPAPGAALLRMFNDLFAGAAAKSLWRAGAQPAGPTNSCAHAPHLQLP